MFGFVFSAIRQLEMVGSLPRQKIPPPWSAVFSLIIQLLIVGSLCCPQ